MAVNYADGFMFASVVFYPVAAAKGAAQAGAGRLTVLFIPAGLAIGIGVTLVGRMLVYSVVEFGLNRCSKIRTSWVKQVVFAPFFLWYFILPWAIIVAGVDGTWAVSSWLVKHGLW